MPSHRLRSAAALALIAALPLQSFAAGTGQLMAAKFDSNGLSSLKAAGEELIVKGGVELMDLKLNGQDAISGEFDRSGPAFDASKRVVQNDYNWGHVRVIYRVVGDRLTMDVEIKNNLASVDFTQMKVCLMQIAFPKTPEADPWKGRFPVELARPDEIPALMAEFGPSRLAFCRDDTGADVMSMGLQPIEDKPWMVWVGIGSETLERGKTRHGTFSIRIGRSDAPTASLTGDVSKIFAKKYPFALNWKDRRPIGSAFLATSERNYPTNPRGWLLDPDMDVTTPDGREAFKGKMMAYADSVVAHCKKLDAQGVIVWDFEGQEMPHATSYIADPRMLHEVAPEMDEIADAFMKKFADAGLRTGLTIRPTRIARLPDGKGWTQQDVKDQAAEIDDKISYAEKRWGCTLFYVDSNVNFVRDPNGQVTNDPAMPAADFKMLAEHHPNALLIPEHKSGAYWANTAPYSEFRLGIASTPPIVRDAYPKAFSVLRVVDGPDLKDADSIQKLTAAVKAGDILLFRPWWDDPQTDDISAILKQAAGGGVH